jgi:serine phosphatase RsbU (regulator of sigma subunit)
MGSDHVVTEFVRKSDGQRVDLISYPLKSANYRLVFAINRSETTGLLSNIKTNTMLAIVISLVAILFLFLYMTHRLANPFKRALELNEQLERKVEERTRELAEKNEELLDSIDYAKRIQEAVLPQEQQLQSLFQEQFVIWRPRDGVGGDFYWVKPTSKGCLIAVGDCTGHGVPGAFMTMLAISALNRIYEQENITQPAALVQRLNVVMKETLNERERSEMMDDGLDFGLCSVEQDEVVFVGAKFSLYMADGDEVKVVSGDKTSIGYRRTPSVYPFKEHRLSCSPGTTVYMTTDGYLDQNGGEKGYSFGRRRFAELIRKMQSQTLEEQQLTLKNELDSYRRGERQRDDITVLAFKVNA